MNRSIKVLIILILTISFPVVSAQECRKYKPGDRVEVKEGESFDIKDYEGWQKIDLPKISFYVPVELKESKEGKSRHPGTFFEYVSEDFRLGLELSNSAYTPNIFDKESPSYCERYTWIDDAFAYIWHAEPNKNYKEYESGVYFQFRESNKYAVGLYLISKTKDTKGIAEKLFKSVKFKYRPEVEKSSKVKK